MTELTAQSDPRTALAESQERKLDAEQSQLVYEIHQRLIQEIDLSALERRLPDAARQAVEATVRALVGEMAHGP